VLKVGLLGAGRIGRVHALNIAGHTRSRLAAVSDVDENASRSLAELYGAAVATSDAILGDASIDAVLIATSTDTHSDLMEKATAAGKAVLCEKPVDLSLERAQRCLESVAKTGVPVMIGFNRRFDPNFMAIKASIAAGDVGKPELLSITSFDPAPPPIAYVKVSGGLFRDMMIHDFDMASFLMGEVPKSVHAVGTSIVDPEIGKAGDVDTAVVTLTYADGRIAVIKNSRRAVYGYDQRIEVLGSEGLLSAGNVLENTVSKATRQGVTGARPEFFFLERYRRAYAVEWDAFVGVVLDGAEIPVTLQDGVSALALAEAATQSVKSGQPVTLAHRVGAAA
jgi:myo-inositol 2-dehydrogenase / D-chiro-inositol 1-dehydrogenase